MGGIGGKPHGDLTRDGVNKPRLSDTARAADREEANVWIAQKLRGARHILVTTDEPRQARFHCW